LAREGQGLTGSVLGLPSGEIQALGLINCDAEALRQGFRLRLRLRFRVEFLTF
jgi:hypothetical protein